MKIMIAVAAAAGLALASASAIAQMHQHGQSSSMPTEDHSMHGDAHAGHMGHGSGHEMGSAPKGDNSPSSVAFNAVNLKMHEAMDITYTGNADVDFIKGMIPHHQGAVDMAKTVLTYGKDPAVRKLAEGIIKAQEDEIAFMQNWLSTNAK